MKFDDYFQRQIDKLDKEIDDLKEFSKIASINIAVLTEQQKQINEALDSLSSDITLVKDKIYDMERKDLVEDATKKNNKTLLFFLLKHWKVIVSIIAFIIWLVAQFLQDMNLYSGIPHG